MFYIVFDFAMAVIMLLFGIWFYRSKGQASKFLSGYNMKSAEERKKYDENAMCKAYGKRMMFMSLPFIAGMIIDIWYIGTGCLTKSGKSPASIAKSNKQWVGTCLYQEACKRLLINCGAVIWL